MMGRRSMDVDFGEDEVESRFVAYVEHLSRVLGHADRVEPLRAYCTGLLLPGERKSVEPMAARLLPAAVSARHQSLLHFVGRSSWDDGALLRAVADWVLPAIEGQGPIRAWIRRRHGLSQERQALGRRRAPVLRSARQDRHLSGGRLALAYQ